MRDLTSPADEYLQFVPCSTCNITDFYHCFVLAQIATRLCRLAYQEPTVSDQWEIIENRRSQICASLYELCVVFLFLNSQFI